MATIRDVARRAGVAPSTVSYALSGKRSISEDARKRILAAITELDFTPSVLGRQLAHSRSNMIGLVFPVPETELAWETLDFLPTAAATLNKHGYGLSVFTGPMAPRQILKLYRENTVDGLILMQVQTHDDRVEILRDKGYPLVCIGRCANTAGLTLVDYATDDALFQVFAYLVHLGHKHVGYLDLPHQKHKEKLGYARLVELGYQRACKAFDLQIVCEESGGTIEEGFRATTILLRQQPHITAIVTAYGIAAIGVLRALRHHQRRVPEDCSLIGISRLNLASWSSPQLTSCDVPLNEMVRIGAELIVKQLVGECAAQQVILPAKVICRESTAPVPLSDGAHLPWLAGD